MFDLCHFGWDGCTIPTNLQGVCSKLPTWKNLKTLRPPQKYKDNILYFPWKYIQDSSGILFLPCYEKGILDNDGGYAQIYRGRRAVFRPTGDRTVGKVQMRKTEHFTEVCIKEVRLNITPEEDSSSPISRGKTYEDEVNAILYEAFLHALLQKALEREGYVSAVPNLYEVIAQTKHGKIPRDPTHIQSIWIIMEYIHGTTLEKYLYIEFASHKQYENTLLLVDIMIQLAFLLNMLQTAVGFNHRDLKINNLFVRYHTPEENWSRVIKLSSGKSYTCLIDIVLIDFGFSCIACGNGCINPRATLVGAGSWFKAEHDCLKYGRDISQFLYSVHCNFPLHDYMTPAMYDILFDAMQTVKNSISINLLDGVDIDGIPLGPTEPKQAIKFNDGIYIFLRDTDIDVPGCKPDIFMDKLLAWV